MIPYDNSKVTLELRELVESGCDIWAFDYPSYYKDAEKKTFEKKVTDHFYFRQIGQETPGRWLHYFRSRMREIMPYYIQLYESAEVMAALDDPFGNVDIVETFEQETTGSSTGSNKTTTEESSAGTESRSESREGSENKERRFSATPQGAIENLDSYLTDAERNANTHSEDVSSEAAVTSNSDSTINNTGSTSNTETITHRLTKKGNQGVNTYAHDMKELRETFLNIDMMVINELKDLFLMVY